MKQLTFLFPFIALIVSCAHSNEPLFDEQRFNGNNTLICNISENPYCSSENEGVDSTKSTLSVDKVPVWSKDDNISVFTVDGTNCGFSLYSGEGTSRGYFKGNLPYSPQYYAIYPYSGFNTFASNLLKFNFAQEQKCNINDFGSGANVMVAHFTKDKPEPAFKNVFGMLELQLAGTAKVGRIDLIGNDDDEMLWGTCALLINGREGSDSQTMGMTEGDNRISLKMNSPVQLSEGAINATSFYFVLPAGSLSSGFTIDIYDSSNNIIYRKQTTNNQSIIRSRIRRMPVIDDVDNIVDPDIVPQPFTWAAFSNHSRGTVGATDIDPQNSAYPAKKSGKYVGIFYFVLHSSMNDANKTMPISNQGILGAGNYAYNDNVNYINPKDGTPHHWGKPYLDYYRMDDEWVIRKHGQMLADAGVDFIVCDVTNANLSNGTLNTGAFYIDDVKRICRIFKELRDNGVKAPQISFMIYHSYKDNERNCIDKNINHNTAITYLYNQLYRNPDWSDLWFKWDGKPLLLAKGADVTDATIKNYFTYRMSWYLWNNNAQTDADMGDGWWNTSNWYRDNGFTSGSEGKWPWAVCYTDANNPMKVGTHNGVNEFASVSPATHPVSNIGRSFVVGQSKCTYCTVNGGTKTYHPGEVYDYHPGDGIYFKSQFDAAMEFDPQIIFFTGWNEWIAGHFEYNTLEFRYVGAKLANHVFVDLYNHEFSRDIEPLDGDFGDNYYYYMADYIRQFKGVDNTPSYSRYNEITIDGEFFDWNKVGSCYADDQGDIVKRNAYRFNKSIPVQLSSNSERNDLHISKVATDGVNVYFYVNISNDGSISGYSEGNTGLNLLIKSNGSSNWEGFNYIVEPQSATTARLSSCSGTGGLLKQTIDSEIRIAVSGKAMEVAVPLEMLGISNKDSFTLDFKWVDNVDLTQDDGIQRCMKYGDSAPNGRFRYRYVFSH